jgi:phosphoglucosamine mutase
MVDEHGCPIDGDKIMAVCAADAKRRGLLAQDTLVATVMSNMGFHDYCRDNGVNVEVAAVGDRYVLERMLEKGYNLGGEQSGHLIFRDHATTGDGQLAAVQFLRIVKERQCAVSELAGAFRTVPQVLIGIPAAWDAKDALAGHPAVQEAVARAEDALDGNGRVLVRASGTEPLVRVMVEGRDGALVDKLAKDIADTIQKEAVT